MKRFIYLFIYLFINCKGQDLNNNDIFIFNFIDNINNPYLIVNEPKTSIPVPKYFTFYNNSDTMKIKCYCNYNNNVYIDSFIFKKGFYELNIINALRNKKKFRGYNLFSIAKYKNSEFYKINFQDTLNVKLKKIKKFD